MWYEYINFSSTKEVKKWGTFVEAIYEPISYLPYRGDHEKNQFYQTILFPWCEWGFDGPLCTIETKDNKVFSLKIKESFKRSDKEPFTLDDIIFSYQDIAISNLWLQPYLTQFQDIQITENENNPTTLIITFPTAKENNRDFFQLPIIPYHIIKDIDLEGYVQTFAAKPITLGCVVLEKSTDTNSLVFDFSKCKDININYYQVKLFENIQALQNHINSNRNIVSFYYGNSEWKSYNLLPLQDNYFMTMFFNTKSTKLSPRIQRSLAWFMNYNLWQELHTGYLSKYEWLLSFYQTTGTNLWEYIENKNPHLAYDKVLLEQWGVKMLPKVFTIDWAKRNSAFYLDSINEKEYTFTIETPDPVIDIKAKSDKSVRYFSVVSDNNNKRHHITFSIGAK